MSLLRLDITDFRNISSVKIELETKQFNFFYGSNASGKTSLLEAIYYLSRGRSFRTHCSHHLINHSAEKLSLFAKIQINGNQTTLAGIERKQDNVKVRVAGQDNSSIKDLLELLPTLLINTHSFQLLEGGPLFRRKYLDWITFYINPAFLSAWKRYERALKQYNAALRERKTKGELEGWRIELIKSGLVLDQLRRETVAALLPFLESILKEVITIPDLKLSYYPGWDERFSFEETINQGMEKDYYAGYTQYGPHRADFKITINRMHVKDILSRGQQKLFICAMIVAQGAMMDGLLKRKPIYLMDDLPAELDSHNQVHLMNLLTKQNAQVFVTTVERNELINAFPTSIKMFHVEQGNVKEVH